MFLATIITHLPKIAIGVGVVAVGGVTTYIVRRKLNAAQEEALSLRIELAGAQKQVRELQQQNSLSELELKTATNQVTILDNKLTELDERIVYLRAELASVSEQNGKLVTSVEQNETAFEAEKAKLVAVIERQQAQLEGVSTKKTNAAVVKKSNAAVVKNKSAEIKAA